MAKKRKGIGVSLYLPDHLVNRARVEADEQDKSTSQIVARALRRYFEEQKVAA